MSVPAGFEDDYPEYWDKEYDDGSWYPPEEDEDEEDYPNNGEEV